jgi:recombination protein RecA
MAATTTTTDSTVLAHISADKRNALLTALKGLEKDHGKGVVMAMGQRAMRVEIIPTGALALDGALGVGGLPRGRITEIYGPESSGKTTLTLQVVANVQKIGGVAAFVDAEHALDPQYARALGVDVDNLLISQPDNGEQALEVVEALVSSGAVDIVVIDSVAALVPRAEIEGEMGDNHVGLQARLMSQALRKLAGAVKRTNTIVIFINQLREKIGVMFGSPETTTGGKALKFYASVRLDIRRIGPVKDREDVIGQRVRVKVVKNKVAPPFRQAEFDLLYPGDGRTAGADHVGFTLDTAAEIGLVQKSGAWYSLDNDRLGQGREMAKQSLAERPEVLARLAAQVRDHILGVPVPADGDAVGATT